jgi:hypothetical protein
MEILKKYWWAVALGVYFMFFNKPKKKRKKYRKPSYIRRRVARYQSRKRWNRQMRARGYRK